MLRSVIINCTKRAIRQEPRTFYTLRNAWSVNLQQSNENSVTLILRQGNPGLFTFKRHKHQNKKHNKNTSAAEDEDTSSSDDSDEENESSSDEEGESSSDEEDISALIAEGLPHYMATKDAKFYKVVVPSPRLDTMAKAVFAISRKQIETQYYNSKLRLNGEVQPKKSVLVNTGDEIDLIIGIDQNNPDMLRIKRAYITDVKPMNKGSGINAVVQKNLLIENYSPPWEPES